MELFSEVYGRYFTVVASVLEQAQNGVTKAEIEKLVKNRGFYESTLHLLPSLLSGEWSLLRESGGKYYAKIAAEKRPLTLLEKAWLKALLSDSRIKLFLDNSALAALENALSDIAPLFDNNDFHVYDKHADGDHYADPEYIARFKAVLRAIIARKAVIIGYDSSKKRTKRMYRPYKLVYSARDDKFRLLCAAFNSGDKITLNLARMTSVAVSETDIGNIAEPLVRAEPVTLEVSCERNSPERFMLQFASFERQTEFNRERGIYICKVWYDYKDETELLIRILSFGPTVKVIGPAGFLEQIKKRIKKQAGYKP